MVISGRAARSFFVKAVGVGSVGLGAASVYKYQQIQQRDSQLPKHTLFEFASTDTNKEKEKKKNVVVVGGGVVGISAAYQLALAGHSVVILEPRQKAGQECSACAAGGMQRSNPTVDKDTWIAVLKCILPFTGNDFKFFHIEWTKTLTDPFFLRWVLNFTRTSLMPDQDQQDKQVEMLKFTKVAVENMIKMMKDPKDDMAKKSGYNPNGSLSLSYAPAANAGTHASGSVKRALEPYRQIVANDSTITDLEPSIRFQQQQPTMAKYEYESCAASAERFTLELARRCQAMKNVTVLYNTTVKGIQVENNDDDKPRIAQLQTNRGVIDIPKDNADVVVAAGAWTPHVLALMDLYAPVYPLKGYAMSIYAKDALKKGQLKPQDLPSRIVSDKYMYTSRLGDEVRITSIGEFSGWSTQPTPQVEEEVRNEAARQFPQLKDFVQDRSNYQVRCGHRPYVSDGILLLGRAHTHQNLLVSCGPGSNGWKLALGSGQVVERLVSGLTEQQLSEELGCDVQTFSPKGRVLQAPLFAKLCRVRWEMEAIQAKSQAEGVYKEAAPVK